MEYWPPGFGSRFLGLRQAHGWLAGWRPTSLMFWTEDSGAIVPDWEHVQCGYAVRHHQLHSWGSNTSYYLLSYVASVRESRSAAACTDITGDLWDFNCQHPLQNQKATEPHLHCVRQNHCLFGDIITFKTLTAEYESEKEKEKKKNDIAERYSQQTLTGCHLPSCRRDFTNHDGAGITKTMSQPSNLAPTRTHGAALVQPSKAYIYAFARPQTPFCFLLAA